MLKKRKYSNNINHLDINMGLSVLEISFQWLIMNIYSERNSGRKRERERRNKIISQLQSYGHLCLPCTFGKEHFTFVQIDLETKSVLLHLLHTCMLKGEEQVFTMIIYQWNLAENLKLHSVCLVCTFANVLHWILFLFFPLIIIIMKHFSPSCDQNNYHDAATYHGTIQWQEMNEQLCKYQCCQTLWTGWRAGLTSECYRFMCCKFSKVTQTYHLFNESSSSA